MSDPGPYLIIAAALFCLGLGAVLTRRNTVVILIGIELMLNAANLNFITFWRHAHPGDPDGVFATLVSIAVAAAEVAVGLALIIAVYRQTRTVRAGAPGEVEA